MSQELRRTYLDAALDYYGVVDEGDDVVLEDGEEIPRWLAITAAGESRYGTVHHSLTLAKDRAVPHAEDNIFAESPIAIVDLDTGRVRAPAFYRVAWVAQPRLEVRDESAIA